MLPALSALISPIKQNRDLPDFGAVNTVSVFVNCLWTQAINEIVPSIYLCVSVRYLGRIASDETVIYFVENNDAIGISR